VKDVTAVTPNDPDEMKSALAVGPIAILLSTTASYTQYKGGIISDWLEVPSVERSPTTTPSVSDGALTPLPVTSIL